MDNNVQDKTITREVGERVNVLMAFEPGLTKQLADGVFEAIVTTSGIDRHGEVIVTDGIVTDAYMKNPVVLYGHDYWALPIGKALKITQQKNKIKVQFQLAIEEYDFAATVASLIKGGYLNAVSLGGVVLKWSEDYRTIEEMEMVEFSVVPVPANADALITARSLEAAAGKSLKTIQSEFKEFAHKALVDSTSIMGEDEINTAIRTLKNLIAALEESAKVASSAGEIQPEVQRIKRITLRENAKAVATQSQLVARTIKIVMSKPKE